ncbi:MAG: aldehyde ferredoxin oxidoreductase N-terminal domain-containing protein [Chloroflexota bacterium]|nr:aldehyde ferredoxin oxidoreductase N-terminal domain-containing protein [Chloroflexota bacterium]
MSHHKGYAGKMMRVDLSQGKTSTVPIDEYADSFLGGRGIAAKVHWDEVSPQTDALDPENRLVFVTGPVCGVPGFSGSRWQICGKSPIHNQFSYCNVGGSWGVQLKWAGYDGLIVHGKADRLVYLLIENDRVEIRDASHLAGYGAINTREKLKEDLGQSFRVVAIGAAGENMVTFATVLADADSSGGSGLGAVMGSKNLKAVAVRGEYKIETADQEKVSQLKERVRQLRSSMIIDMPALMPMNKLKKDVCWGCNGGCLRTSYEAEDSQVGKYMCQSSFFYQVRAQRYYGQMNDVPFQANKLCDDYGVDTRAIETMIMWLSRCYQSKTLTEEESGLPFSKMGSLEFIDTLLRKISFREGFGDVLANGTLKAVEVVGKDSGKLITDYMMNSGENAIYGPRLYITTGLFYATEPRMPIQLLHEISVQAMMWTMANIGIQGMYLTSDVMRSIGKRFWGSEIAADFSTYEGKALAAAKIQDRQYAKECMIVCDFAWPIIHSPATEDHVGDPTLESQLCAAITGRDVDEAGLYNMAERVFNLQRAVLVREGHRGREYDSLDEFEFSVPLKGDFGNPECMVPGKNGEPFSRKGMVVDRDQFEKMKDEYYEVRGWDVTTGLQKKAKLEELGLGDVAQKLSLEGMAV